MDNYNISGINKKQEGGEKSLEITKEQAKELTETLYGITDIQFDEDGFYYFEIPDSFEFIVYVYIDKDDYNENIFKIEFRDGYLGDFESETIASELDKKLLEIEDIYEVYWEDRELFHITHSQNISVIKLIEKIEKEVIKLSKTK